VVELVKAAGLVEYHVSHDEINGSQRITNLQELANAASLYPANREGLLEFLEHIELDRSIEQAAQDGENQDAVTLITLHNTKGLEFRRVIMTGLEQGIFPREDKEHEDLEEERRLFYVGATRAMDELYLTSCALRRMYGRTQPMESSLFLRETDRSCLRVLGTAPYGFVATGKSAESGKGFSSPDFAARRGGFAEDREEGTTREFFTIGKGAVSSDGRWRTGDRLYHDDNGYGTVIGIREGEDGPVVQAHFDTGKEVRFLSLHQSARFMKVGDD
jgi:DNA helicase-2/ATP-dependent DNA helicase PcrA